MELTTDKMNKLLALNDEQKALLAEMKALGEKMKKANLIILFDSFEVSFAAINGEHIEDVQNELETDDEAVEMSSWCENWGNMETPYDFEFRSSYGNPYLLFKEDVRKSETEIQKALDAALAYC